MARSVNKVIVLGNLGRDAETKFMENGTALSRFSVATTHSYKQGDEWKEQTEWHNVVAWKKEKLAQYLVKGTQVYVEGRLQTRSWEDKDGQKRYSTEIIAENIVLLGGKRDGASGFDGGGTSDAGWADDEQPPF